MSYLEDPRVLFAAERTLLAWNRTAVALITLGFVIERFGLFIQAMHLSSVAGQRDLSFIVGLSLIGFASITCILSVLQFRKVINSLSAAEIPKGYKLWYAVALNIAVSLLGGMLVVYLIRGLG